MLDEPRRPRPRRTRRRPRRRVVRRRRVLDGREASPASSVRGALGLRASHRRLRSRARGFLLPDPLYALELLRAELAESAAVARHADGVRGRARRRPDVAAPRSLAGARALARHLLLAHRLSELPEFRVQRGLVHGASKRRGGEAGTRGGRRATRHPSRRALDASRDRSSFLGTRDRSTSRASGPTARSRRRVATIPMRGDVAVRPRAGAVAGRVAREHVAPPRAGQLRRGTCASRENRRRLGSIGAERSLADREINLFRAREIAAGRASSLVDRRAR